MRTSIGWIGGAGLAALLALVGLGGAALAQDEEPFSLVIVKWTCESDPGQLGFGFEVPDDCEPTSGVSFDVVAADAPEGDVIDSCTIAEGSGGCNVEVPYGIGSVLVYEDEAGAPAGYAPRENPIEVQIPDAPVAGEAPTAIFVNLPVADDGGTDDGDTDDGTDDPTTLPDTGVGPAAGDAAGTGWLALIGAAALLGGAGCGLRRRALG